MPADPSIGAISRILDKLQPKILCTIIIVGLFLIATILGIAVFKGQQVNFFGIKISSPPKEHTGPPPTEHKAIIRNDEQAISAFELAALFGKYFDSKYNKEQLISNIRQLVSKAEDTDNLESNFFFKALRLELMIPKFGSYIDTKSNDKDRVEAYKRIQSALKDIGYFDGEIIGDQPSTYNALVTFQKAYNQKARRAIFDPSDFGKFGYRTLEAIRSWYRQAEQIQESPGR